MQLRMLLQRLQRSSVFVPKFVLLLFLRLFSLQRVLVLQLFLQLLPRILAELRWLLDGLFVVRWI